MSLNFELINQKPKLYNKLAFLQLEGETASHG